MTTSLNKARGSAAEREVARLLGGIRVGMDGGPTDVVAPGLRVQVKKVTARPSAPAISRMLQRIEADRFHPVGTPAVVVIHRQGAGRRATRTLYLAEAECRALYGRLDHPWTYARGLASIPLSTYLDWYGGRP